MNNQDQSTRRNENLYDLNTLFNNLKVLYEDNHLIAFYKPPNILTQGDETKDPSMIDIGKLYLKNKYDKPGNVFLGLVHRLDRPVGGILLMAKTSKAASRLAAQFRTRTVEKVYLAITNKHPKEKKLKVTSFLKRTAHHVQISDVEFFDSQIAILEYEEIATEQEYSLLKIALFTGRYHQIRAQLSHIGLPICGDRKFKSLHLFKDKSLGLMAYKLSFNHPVTEERITLISPVPETDCWKIFSGKINSGLGI